MKRMLIEHNTSRLIGENISHLLSSSKIGADLFDPEEKIPDDSDSTIKLQTYVEAERKWFTISFHSSARFSFLRTGLEARLYQ